MLHKLTKHGTFCKQNNQLPTKIHVELKDNSNKAQKFTAALHLEARPICCVRGLKSSLVIGQKAENSPNPFTPRGQAKLVV
jgi:hypothetical protein